MMAGLIKISRIASCRGTSIMGTISAHHCRHKSTVGFVGLGNMGAHMAKNLIKKGYPVVVFDLDQESVKSVKEAGASSAGSPGEVAAQTKEVVTMLPSSPHVREVSI